MRVTRTVAAGPAPSRNSGSAHALRPLRASLAGASAPEPEVRFEDGLPQTIDWYRDNEWWWARSGAVSTASATSGTTAGRSAERPAVRRRYGVTSNRLLNGFSSGSFSQLEKPASCVSSLAFAGGSPQVPSPAPPFASDVVMQ